MPLLLTERDVTDLLTMRDAMDAVESAFAALGSGDGTVNEPRSRFFLPHGVMHLMSAAIPGQSVMGTKTYTSYADGTRFWVMLFSSDSGELLALIESNRLGQVRTGAATGVAAKYMALDGLTRVSLLGAGWQAEAQAEALLISCPHIVEFQVYSRHYVPRERFCQKMTRRLSVRFTPMDSAEAAVRTTQAIICSTTSRDPVLLADWLQPGDFVAAVGSNRLSSREIEEAVVERATVVAVDDLIQAKSEAAELLFAHERRKFSWESAIPLADIVSGHRQGRKTPEDITLFKSLGVALEDIAVAAVVYEKAREAGRGQAIPTTN